MVDPFSFLHLANYNKRETIVFVSLYLYSSQLE
jgi:hypothetical protein